MFYGNLMMKTILLFILIFFLFPICVLADTTIPQQAPLNQPAPNVVLTPSSQELKQTNTLFRQSKFQYFHHYKKLTLFKIPKQ